jgi:hypothetical protein
MTSGTAEESACSDQDECYRPSKTLFGVLDDGDPCLEVLHGRCDRRLALMRANSEIWEGAIQDQPLWFWAGPGTKALVDPEGERVTCYFNCASPHTRACVTGLREAKAPIFVSVNSLSCVGVTNEGHDVPLEQSAASTAQAQKDRAHCQ